MQGSPPAAPRPGDPRSTGPRPPAGWRDVVWLALAVGIAAVTALQFVRLAWTALGGDLPVTTGGLVLAFVITVVWLLTIHWLVAGSWRRSVWGCPFEHTEAAVAERRCQRHPLVAGGGSGPWEGGCRTG
ncbi:hypothetical protein [Egicoccus halophilus]|uniref:Uncharacterized protein n=1 Tax=Egicoccus halophilus TaxID=1670830 RepID=A0A8J3AAT2_9ACTN|nr:hypothetical protein [Egicoccus halophilus]GGI06919.1 hypothetical protein GCM10011354_21500 [Egicoccus halophilus]